MAALTYSGGAGSGASQQQVLNQATGQSQGNQNQTGSETGTLNKTTQTSGSQVQASSTNMSNMTPQAQAILQQLLSSLQDRPAISREEAAMILAKQGIKAPAPFITPSTSPADMYGRPVDNISAGRNAYAQSLQEYEARIAEVQKSGGIIQGGTQETNIQKQQNLQQQETLNKAREGYSKEAAFADASMLQSRAMRQMLEQLLPSLNAAIEASGTSGGATAALLKNDAAARSAESAAALGLDAAVKYGGIFDEQSKIISGLIESNTPVLNALLQGLGIAKGAVQQGGTTQSTLTNQTANESGITSSQKSSDTSTNQSEKKVALLTPDSAGAKSKAAGFFENYTF